MSDPLAGRVPRGEKPPDEHIAALHLGGLATRTHTPQPMRFLNRILGRPDNERPYIVLPIGDPAPACTVPAITRKPATAMVTWVE